MNHSLTTSAYIKLLRKDGLTMDDLKPRNEKKKEMESLLNHLFSWFSDMKSIRMFLRRNNEMHRLKTRELNEGNSIDEYKLVKRNGQADIYSRYSLSSNIRWTK